jgi:N-terminal acetyltransferase B complex non-catalytic subunit
MMDIGDSSEITSQISSYRQKMALLPRLAESLSSRMVLSSQQTPSDSSASVVASENDWDVYLETLLVQGKKLEALDVLKNIYCTPMVGDSNTGLPPTTDGDEDSSRRHGIVDEGTINNHVGSMLRYTRRKQLERMAQLSHELDMFTNAEGYYRELLLAFPDQWTYWMGLVESSCVRPSSSSLSDGEERIVSIDKAGRQRCHSFAKEIASNNVDKHTLRGPLLVLVELAALELRQAPSHSTINEVDERRRLMALLRDEICEYGNRFGSQASCCFSDVRSYLRLLVQASLSGGEITGISDIPNEVSHLLEWARGMWVSNAQSTDTGSLEVEDELRERRKKLRSFIFAVQVVYGIAAEMKDLTLHLLQTFAPSTSQLVLEWRTSLVSLPIVAAKDGGQKEVLPGDEIILLASQYLLFQASLHPPSSNESNHSSTTMLLQSAALLEESMDHSPYNPHLKIAAISVYSKLNAAGRALSIFQDMGVKQIQLDSCSYIILPLLIRGGLYTSAIKLSTSILRLHGSTSKDVKTYSSKSLQNGLMLKAKEMVTFQCEKMRPSLQLLYSKGLLLDNAPLMIASDLENETLAVTTQKGKSPTAGLAAEKGFCGKEEDLMRAEQLAIDAEIHVNAPAIVHTSAQSSSIENFSSSDNRDKTVNYFEVLSHTSHLSHLEMVVESLRRGHVHGLLARAIMAAGTATAPKKGKLVKPTVESAYRCQSLRYALLRANDFGHNAIMDEVDRALWNTCCQLCEVINVVIYGSSCDESTDTIAGREALAVSVINSTTELIQSARQAFTSCNSAVDTTEKRTLMGGKVCRLLPDYIVPSFILLETTSRLFSLFGWGKRKRLTKAASGSLALAAISLQDFILDMLHFLADFRSVSGNIQSLVEAATSPELGKDAVQRVVGEVVSSRELTKDRVDFFLVEMMDGLQCFNEEL